MSDQPGTTTQSIPNRRRDYRLAGRLCVLGCCCLVSLIVVIVLTVNANDGPATEVDDDDDGLGMINVSTTSTATFTMTTSSGGTPSPTSSDCCPADSAVYAGSPFVSAQQTACGDYDYNCDGVEDTLVCGILGDAPQQNGTRQLWHRDTQCVILDEECGACSGSTLFTGWSCRGTSQTAKRYTPPCPAVCDGAGEQVSPSIPSIGQCALAVTGCAGQFGSESLSCGQATQG